MRALLLIMPLYTALPVKAAAPPVSLETVKRDLQRAQLLEGQAYEHALAGRFADALKVDRETLGLRSRWLPQKHLLVQGSKQDVEAWARLAQLSSEQQKQVGTALRANRQGLQLNRQGQYAAAEKPYRKALAIYRQVLGEEHPHTALSYNNLAVCLDDQTQHDKALPLHKKALAIRRKVLGEEHPSTAQSYNNLAACLDHQGQRGKALLLFEKALAIRRKVLGEEHPTTALSYNNVAACLDAQGQHGKALPLLEHALVIRRKVLGEVHPDTASSYNNVACCLDALGEYGKALPLYEKALAIKRKLLGEDHPDTALCYNNVASCLKALAQYGKAQSMYEKALAIHRRVLGEEHSHTALSYNNLALCLNAQAQFDKAQPMFEKALHICRKVRGDEHANTATSFNNLALCLHYQAQYEKALPHYEKALQIRRKMLGEGHPETASSYNNLSGCLDSAGQHRKALPLSERALAIRRKVLGEQHPDTADSYSNVALCLWRLDRVAAATRLLQSSLAGQEVARFHKASSGFDRALATRYGLTTGQLLALGLARLRQPRNALAHADASLARGLLDDLVHGHTDVSALASQLARLDERLVPLYGRTVLSPAQAELREELFRQRRRLSSEMARRTAAVSARQLLSLADIQKQIPRQAALVFWIDSIGLNEYQACILRHEGTPVWVRLTGSGKDGKWTEEEQKLHQRLYDLLGNPQAGSALERQNAIAAMRRLCLEPLVFHFRARDSLPAVRHLLVVPTGWAAGIPLEVLTSDYHISYVPSGSAFARLRQQARPLSGTSLLALGDPVFTCKPVRRSETLLVQRGPDPTPLPATRREVAALAALVPGATVWLGSDASEQRIDELIARGKLRTYRLVHLATHGQFKLDRPELSSVLLARDNLPDALKQAQQLRKVYTGELTVDTIRRQWRDALDADLGVLSACVTGLGTHTSGDGMLGFAQALLSRGARCVVLSRWYVSDDATALLMQRFYQNLLGKRPGLKKALSRAEALEEARNWLRNLSRAEAGAAVTSLPRGEVKSLPGTAKPPPARPVPPGDRPYAQPYYWSAFVLIGDPY
jgi:tetratricopeptide (TPR) repeat protein